MSREGQADRERAARDRGAYGRLTVNLGAAPTIAGGGGAEPVGALQLDPAGINTERRASDGTVVQVGRIRNDADNRARARAKGWTVVASDGQIVED